MVRQLQILKGAKSCGAIFNPGIPCLSSVPGAPLAEELGSQGPVSGTARVNN